MRIMMKAKHWSSKSHLFWRQWERLNTGLISKSFSAEDYMKSNPYSSFSSDMKPHDFSCAETKKNHEYGIQPNEMLWSSPSVWSFHHFFFSSSVLLLFLSLLLCLDTGQRYISSPFPRCVYVYICPSLYSTFLSPSFFLCFTWSPVFMFSLFHYLVFSLPLFSRSYI
jgi:hypothetical protein